MRIRSTNFLCLKGDRLIEEYRVSMQKNYFCLCLSQIKVYESICQEINLLQSKSIDKSEEESHIAEMNLEVQYELQEQAVLAPIVFAAMCVEAFIYDYGASHLSDPYMTKRLDKLDVVSKLMVVTKLVLGKDFPVDGQAFEELQKLIKNRNRLVHFKSKKFDIKNSREAIEFRKNLNVELEKSMYDSVRTVRLLMIEMDKLHGFQGKYENSIEPTQCHA
jgi:hypothetical protein